MADLAQLDLRAKGGEARLRALLEDLISYYKGGIYPSYQLALVVWFGKSPQSPEQNLLALFTGPALSKIALSQRQSLNWKTGSEEPPYVNIYATSVNYFAEQLSSNSQSLARYFDKFEVLYFDKQVLSEDILRTFNVVAEPAGLMKGWYVTEDQYAKSGAPRNLLASRSQSRPEMGLVKTYESPDFENCRGVIQMEVSQRWIPVSLEALQNYTFYVDSHEGRSGYFLFQGGALYEILRFELKTAPDYSARFLTKLRDDRYPEVYLREVPSPKRPAA